jgi:hypothetical protein
MRKCFFILWIYVLVSFSSLAQIPTAGLVGYWPFNQNADDESSNTNIGTVTGATLTGDRFGKVNSAYLFDGNDFISIPHHSSLDMSGAVSFSVWIKPSEIQTSGNRMILGKSNYSTTTNYLIRQKPNGYIQWEYNGYAENNINPITVNSWHHIVVTAAGPTLDKKIYLDNQLVATQSPGGASYGLVNNALTFGYAEYNSEYYIGIIDDIRMYNKELSVSEVNLLFNEVMSTPTIVENTFQNIITSYPNPANGEVFVDLGKSFQDIGIVISDINGRVIRHARYKNCQFLEVPLNEGPGFYFLTITAENKKVTLRIIRN